MVYFVVRSVYEKPSGRRVMEFPECKDLVDWFRKIWLTREEVLQLDPKYDVNCGFEAWEWQDEIYALRESIFGGYFCGLFTLLEPMLERSEPKNLADVEDLIASFDGRFAEGSISMNDGAIQAYTNDDEVEIAWYLFDGSFADSFPERVSFLISKNVDFPTVTDSEGWIPPVFTKNNSKGNEATFCCFLSSQDGLTITEVDGCYSFPARLPQFGQWLSEQPVNMSMGEYGYFESDWSENLILLRAMAICNENQSFQEALKKYDSLNGELSHCLSYHLFHFQSSQAEPMLVSCDPSAISEQLSALREASDKSGVKLASNYWIYSSGESYVQISRHFCQVVFCRIKSPSDNHMEAEETIEQWIFFDDLWASANRQLAESMLRYGRGLNVLGP